MYIRNSSDNIGLEVSGGKIIDSSSSVILAGGNLEMSYIDKITPLYIEGYGANIDNISSIRIIDNKGGTIPVEETSSAGVFRTTSSLYSLIEENDITFIDIKVTKQVDTTTTTTSTLPAFKIIKVNNKTNIPIEILPGNHLGITTFIGTIPVDGVVGFDSILWGDTLGIIFGCKLDVGSELPKNFRIVAYTENGSYIEVPYNLHDQGDSHYPYLAIKIDIFPIIENTNIKSIYVYGTFLDYSTTSSTPTPITNTTSTTTTTTTTTSTKYPNISLTNSTNQNFILTAPIIDGRDYQELLVGGTAYIKQDDSVQTISLSDSMLDMKNADIIIRVYTAESSYEFYQFEKKRVV